MSDDKIKIEIDGLNVSADKGQMLIEVTDKNQINTIKENMIENLL